LNALDKAHSDNDEARILFYDSACHNLLDEMYLMSNNNWLSCHAWIFFFLPASQQWL